MDVFEERLRRELGSGSPDAGYDELLGNGVASASVGLLVNRATANVLSPVADGVLGGCCAEPTSTILPSACNANPPA